MNKFHNPYAGHTKPTVQTPISVEDYNLIKCIRPGLGTISGTMGTLWNKLCYALRERGITDYSKSSEFEHFVANCTIVDGGLSNGPINSTLKESDASDECARISRAHSSNPPSTSELQELERKEHVRQHERGEH